MNEHHKNFVLHTEDASLWQNLLNTCIETFRPADPLENELVIEIAFARWRMRRIWSIETAIIDAEINSQAPQLAEQFRQIDGAVLTAAAVSGLSTMKSGVLGFLTRYEANLRRVYERAVANLQELRKQTENGQNKPKATPVKVGPSAVDAENGELRNEPEHAQPAKSCRNEPELPLSGRISQAVAALIPRADFERNRRKIRRWADAFPCPVPTLT